MNTLENTKSEESTPSARSQRVNAVAWLTGITAVCALGILFLAGCCTTHHFTQWEYKNISLQVYQLRPPNLSSALNDLGKDGWVVVGFTQDGTGDYATLHYLLKRAKQ